MWDKPTLLNWIANLLFAVSVVVMLYAALFAVVHLPIFPLREVKVDGELSHVNREQVKLIVAKHLKGNFFTLDLVKARNAFEKLPWARNVSLRRRWPDTLEVVIEEHQALARWGTIALVNTHGELFHAASGGDLPMFYGPADGVIEVASQYGEFSKILKTANLNIANLALTPRRAWEITTTDGMVVELGRVEMQPRLEKFVSVYSRTIAGLNMKVTYADLRYPNGFAVRKPVQIKAGEQVQPAVEDKSLDTTTLKDGVFKPSISKPSILKPGKTKPTDIIKQQT
ncbi:MAG: cell division protein FtsQ/DivIB [Methylotenera sp.]|uniref:cell division protein FtsQ/DivIB n=1 Tax=Methylotenera sp. TaxID=2051956 RepID=UPI00248A0E6A|nr:cell division protein FtsQ/DivIB [Methylotenera sp.]MDI1309800.1 cell division protein FtsQ/DivIB [Methylotenera sp.]